MIREHDEREHDMDDGDLRTCMRHAVAEVAAPLNLYEQVAGSARKRQRARVQVGAGAVVLALGAAVGVGVGDPFEWRGGGGDQVDAAAPDSDTTKVPPEASGTAVAACPDTAPEPSNPGVTQGAMLPDRPGRALLCSYPWSGAGVKPTEVTLSAAASEQFASMVNSSPQSPGSAERACSVAMSGEAVFFRNAAGHEAVLIAGGTCRDALTDGRVQVPWNTRTSIARLLPG
ncbi:hypothetical protein [Streptodolium elevatio]|uniref:Serine/threonine protein kinase n=1 Tax=Streptodolium elevatio TaxID=3157996 RepID=A0ABV3D964_9ACTN